MPRSAANLALILPLAGQSLESLTVEELKWYAAVLPGPIPGRKGELVTFIASALTDRAPLQRLWETLSPEQQLVVADVVHHFDGRYDPDVLEARYPAVAPPAVAERYYSYYSFSSNSKKKAATAFDLLFAYRYDLGRYIPPDITDLLKTFAPPPPPPHMHSHEAPPQIPKGAKRRAHGAEVYTTDAERAVFHDLTATLNMVQQGKLSVSSATRLPTLPVLRQLRPRLLLGDYFADGDYERAEDAIRPLALAVLVQAAKWAAPGGTGSKLEVTKAGQALLAGSLQPRHIKEAWERWLRSDVLDELSRIRSIKGQGSKEVRLTKPADRREKLAAALRACPVGLWVDFDELLRYMRAESQLPTIERNATPALRVGSYADYEELGYGHAKYWDVIIGSYLRVLVWEYAATLGLVEVAYTRPEQTPHDFGQLYGLDDAYLSRYDGLLGLRLTNLGAYVLGLTVEYTPPAPVVETGPPLLRVLPNLDVVITDSSRLLPNERAVLDRIGMAQSENVYHLDRDLLLDSIENGLDVEQVLEFLAAKSGVPGSDLPQTVRVFFSDLTNRLGALRTAGRMLVLDSDDPYLLAELANAPALRALVQIGKIGERPVLLVSDEQETAVRRQLKKLGYLPGK